MGSRSTQHQAVSQKIRENHNPETAKARQMEKIQRKFNRPIWQLRGARAMFRNSLGENAPGKAREWCENQGDLPEDLRNELNRLAKTESTYFNWRADTELRRGYYNEHTPTRDLVTRVAKAAAITAKGTDLDPGELAGEFIRTLCSRQYTPGSKTRRK